MIDEDRGRLLKMPPIQDQEPVQTFGPRGPHRRLECFDRLLILSQQHLERILTAFVDHDNRHRPHRALSLAPPEPRQPTAMTSTSLPSRQIWIALAVDRRPALEIQRALELPAAIQILQRVPGADFEHDERV